MDLSEVMKLRRSVRRFKKAAISSEIINEIIENASLAPETDTCSYYFGIIDDSVTKKKLAEATLWAEWIAEAPVIFACCGDITWDIADQTEDSYGVLGNKLRYSPEIIDYLRENENRSACKRLLQAPAVYIAAQHMILTAVAHGLRGCLVDFMDLEKINNILELPENISCQVLVPVGYTAEVPAEKDSFKLEQRVFHNRFGEKEQL